jgi:dolichyl-phosphate-mannose-protein mannosyltransferase
VRSAHAALALLVIVVVALSVGSVRLDSATSDEPAHIASGVIKIQERSLDFFREQPPLMNSLSALPVVLSGYRIAPGWQGANHWVVGRKFLYYSGYDPYRILFLARMPTIVLFAALIVCVYAFVLWQTGSVWWALGGAALTGFCPNLMAHGRLATVDLALAFFSFAAAALLLRMIDRPSPAIAILFGIASAAAPLSKVSGLILFPWFAVVIAAALIARRIVERRRFLISLGVAIVAGLVFFEAVGLAEIGPAFAGAQYPAMARPLIPFAEYLANIRTINAWYERGNAMPQFLLGQFSQSGWPHYYLVAFLLKTPIPAIVLLVTALVTGVRLRAFAFFAMLSFVVLFFAVAAAGHLALGIRYVLPVYPFLYAMTAIALHAARLQRAGIALVTLLIAWHAVENLRTYPSYIAYFNELIGSPRNADRFLIDSNLDWGQDLRRLDLWLRAHGARQLTIHYFGGGGIESEMHVPTTILMAPGPGPLPKGWFALSRHFYRLSSDPEVWGIDYDDYLAACGARLVTSIGGSINVYRVEGPRR